MSASWLRMVFANVLLVAFVQLACARERERPYTPSQLYALEANARLGDIDAQYKLGELYFRGAKGVVQDSEKGLAWLRQAADGGEPNAQGLLGWAYWQGKDVEKDVPTGIALLEQAADHGVAPAQALLGLIYFRGMGVQQDRRRSMSLWHSAAGKGNPQAEANLGAAYFLGIGVPKDRARAVSLWRSAAGKGNALARRNLSRLEEMERAHRNVVRRENQIALEKGLNDFAASLGRALAGSSGDSSPALTCTNDIECGIGNRCVKPHDSFGDGVCVRPVDDYGMPIMDMPDITIGPHESEGCSFDTECGIGFTCRKMAGSLRGLCVR